MNDSTIGVAEDAIDDLAAQLDMTPLVEEQGEYSGNTPHDSYDEYLDEFRDILDHEDGWQGLLLYNRRFKTGEGGTQDSWPNLGASRGMNRWDQDCLAIVNANLFETGSAEIPIFGAISAGIPRVIFKNVVKHELLHSCLDEANEPATTDEDGHSFGELTSKWYQPDMYTSPMLTGYSEPKFSNPTPGTICDGNPDDDATGWKGDISGCTEEEAKRWYDEEYTKGL